MDQVKPIYIEKTPFADSRTLKENKSSKELLIQDSKKHIAAVRAVMDRFADICFEKGNDHDWTKLGYIDEFFRDYEAGLTNKDFKNAEWYQIHIDKERHHLNSKSPEDVDLFDVLELIADCTVAGKARFNNVDKKFFQLPDGLLKKAYLNTIEKLIPIVKIKE